MSFFNKIKYNYNIKLLDEHFKNDNLKDALDLLNKISKSSPDIFFNCLKFIDPYLNNLSPSKFYNNKIIWNISYNQNDIKYINNFIYFYLQKSQSKKIKKANYSAYLSDILEKYNIQSVPEHITFQEIINLTNIFHNLILIPSDSDYFLLDTCAAFFESENNKYFIYPNKTQCFFYVYRNPEDLYSLLKNQTQSKDAAFNELFNFNQSLFLNEDLLDAKYKVYENRTDWNINVKSWTDNNVVSTFKGKVIRYEDLIKQTEDILIDIIYHLKQSGLDLDLNYDLINSYLLENPIKADNFDSISNQEKKSISKNIDQSLVKEFNL